MTETVRITASIKSLGYKETITVYRRDIPYLDDYLRHWEPNGSNSRVYGMVISSTFQEWNATLAYMFARAFEKLEL